MSIPTIFPAFLALLLATAAAKTSDAFEVELNGKPPYELIEELDNGGSRLLFWSTADNAWLEIFRSEGEIGLSEDPNSVLKMVKDGERFWQWRNTNYVPLVAEPAREYRPLPDDLYARAYEQFHELGFDEMPPNSPVNMVYGLPLAPRQMSEVIVIADPLFCRNGGTVCPVLTMTKNEIGKTYLPIGEMWGVSPRVGQDGLHYLEVQREDSIELRNPMSPEKTGEIDAIAPTIAEPQPSRPRGA